MTMLTLCAGTSFLMWLGEQITEKGIGNGISLIIFSGIVARMPNALASTGSLVNTGEMNWFVVILLMVMMFVVVAFIIYMETSQRRIPVQYAKRVVGRKMYGGQSTHLPLKINQAGVIPPIFASSIIMFPATIANFIQHPYMKRFAALLTPGRCGLRDALRRLYHLLLLFLHGHRFQSGQRSRQHEEVRRIYTGHQARQEDLRVHREDPFEDHFYRAPSTYRSSACCRRSWSSGSTPPSISAGPPCSSWSASASTRFSRSSRILSSAITTVL